MGALFTKDIAVLDVTSRLISAIIGAKKAQSVFAVKAMVEREHSGFENGEWLDGDETSEVAAAVLGDAMRASGSRVKRVFIGVPSEFVTVVTKEIEVRLDRSRRVVDADVDYLVGKGMNFDGGQYVVINTSPVHFSVDTSDKLYFDVRGMTASSITGTVTYILCERAFTAKFDAVAAALGFKEIQYISTAWAECLALFEKEQRDCVFALVDVGYISSSIAIGRGDGLMDLKSFSLGGGHISADMFRYLEVPFELAEQARQLVDLNLTYAEDAVLVGDSEHTVYAQDACDVVRAKLDAFAEIIFGVLKSLGFDMPSYMPVYLTGEGVAEIRGAKKYLGEQLGKNIEIAAPKLPGFPHPGESSKTSLLIVAESLAKNKLGDYIIKAFNGGKV